MSAIVEYTVNLDGDTRSSWLDLSPVSLVYLIHLRKIVHAAQEDVDLDHFLEVGTGFLQNGTKILDAFVLPWSTFAIDIDMRTHTVRA